MLGKRFLITWSDSKETEIWSGVKLVLEFGLDAIAEIREGFVSHISIVEIDSDE